MVKGHNPLGLTQEWTDCRFILTDVYFVEDRGMRNDQTSVMDIHAALGLKSRLKDFRVLATLNELA